MNDGDSLNGLGGADVLNAIIDASADAYLTSIETLNITALGASASMDGVRIVGATNINVDGGGTLTLENAAAGITYSVSGAGTALTLTQAGSDTTTNSVALTLGAGKLGTQTLGVATGVDFETINITIAGSGSATITEAAGGGTASFAVDGDSIVVNGTGDYELDIAAALLGASATAGSQSAAVISATGHIGKLTIDLGALTTTNNVSAEKWTGVDAIKLKTDAANSDVNIITKVASGTEIIVDGQEAVDNRLTITPNGSATTDALTVTLNNATAGSVIDLTSVTVDGFETVTINSTGTNKLNTNGTTTTVKNVIDTIAGTASDKNLTIAGDKVLTAGVENTFTSITVTNTAGSNLTVAAGGELTYVGGAGADRLELDTLADITAQDSLNGGAGKDTLAISQTIGTDFSTAQLARVSNFEVLEYVGAQNFASGTIAETIDLTKITGVNELFINGALTTDAGDTLTVKAADGLTLKLGAVTNSNATSDFDVQITDAATAGTANSVNLQLVDIVDGTGSSDGAVTMAGFRITGVETLNISLLGDETTPVSNDEVDTYTISDIDGVVLQSITIASANTGVNADGTKKVSDSLTITDVESTILTTINASTFTGALNISGLSNNLSVTGATITGGSGVNTIFGGSGADTITTGKGNDVIHGGLGADVINSGAGNDIVLAATGAGLGEATAITTISGSGSAGAIVSTGTVDVFTAQVFGKAFAVTASSTFDNATKIGAEIKRLIEADADVSKLVDVSAASGAVRVVAKVDGNFVNFTITANNSITLSASTTAGETQRDGTASTDIDIVNLGSGADFVHTGGGVDLIDLGANDGATDTVYILTLTEGGSKISNFEAGTIGTDVIKFAGNLLNNGTSETSDLVSITNTGATIDNRVFFEITTATAAGGADTAAEIAAHLKDVTLTSIADGDDILFAVNDGTDMYLWAFTEDATAGIQADDLVLVGVLNGVTDIINGDLAQIA